MRMSVIFPPRPLYITKTPSYQLNTRLNGFRKESSFLDKRKISFPAGIRSTISRLSSLRPSHNTDYASPVICHRLKFFLSQLQIYLFLVFFYRSFIPTNFVLNLLLSIFYISVIYFRILGYLFYQVLYIYVHTHTHTHTPTRIDM